MQEYKKNEYCLCVSDLHLSNWPNQSPEPNYRKITQPMALADRIIQLLQEYNTDCLFILGDLIDSWNEDPSVINVLIQMYRKIIDAHPNVYIGYIEGQHDMFIRDRYEVDNSYVHIAAKLFPNNVHYCHKTLLEINNTSIFLSSFSRKEPIYPEQKVNVFLSHITLGQTIVDESKFDLCVAGDIHALYDEGKCHSCSPAIPIYAHEEQQGWISLIHLQGENSTFKRLPSDSDNFHFLRLQRTTTRQIESKNSANQEIVFDNSKIMDMIQEEVKKNGIETVHNLMDLKNIPNVIDFKVKFKKLIIDNVRSIQHLELNLEDLAGINYLAGDTGSGKSTIFYSLFTALLGDKKDSLQRKNNTVTKKPLKLQLYLTYNNQEFYICRTIKDLKFTVNGEDVTGSKKETQQRIEEYLPFVKYCNYFYLKANKHYFDNIDKTELMKVLFNLEIFSYLENQAHELFKAKNRDIKEIENNLLSKHSNIELRQNDLLKANTSLEGLEMPKIKQSDIEPSITLYNKQFLTVSDYRRSLKSVEQEVETKRNFIKDFEEQHDNIQNLESLKQEIDSCKHQNESVNQCKYNIVSLKSKLQVLKNVKVTTCPHCGKVIQGQDIATINRLETELKQYEEQYKYAELIDLEVLLKIQQGTKTYYDYLKDVQEKEPKIQKAKAIIDKIENELQAILNKYNCKDKAELDGFYHEIISKEQVYNQLQNQIKDLKTEIVNLNSEIKDLEKQKLEIVNFKDLIEKYMNLFDIENIESIPYSILKKLVSCLNTDNIKFVASTSDGEFEVNAYIKIGNQWISYEDCSDGQKNFLDIYILIRISSFMNGIGFLAMDEPIANMSAEYVQEAGKLLSEIKAQTILISSHCHFEGYDRVIKVALTDKGLTKVTL